MKQMPGLAPGERGECMKKLLLRDQVDQVREEYKDDPFRCAQELKKLLKTAEQEADVYSVAKINLFLSSCVFEQGRRDSILAYAYKAVSILENLNDYSLLARGYNLMGIAYAGQGDFQSAIASYNKALRVIRGRKKPGIRRESLLNNIGDSYYQMGAYQKSLGIAMSCLSNCRKKNPDNHRAIVLYGINVSDCYFSLGEYHKAKEVLDDTRADVDCLPNSILVCGYYTRLSGVLYAIGDAENGAKYSDLMLDMAGAHCDSYEFHHVFDRIASYQIEIGDINRARRISDALTRYSNLSGHTLDLIITKRVQANICEAVGDRDRAFTLHKELNVLYEKRILEQNAIQYESQMSVESAGKEIERLMNRIRLTEEKAERDPLTGLMNRSALTRVSAAFYQDAVSHGKKLGGIFLDIDYFKEYNDTYGHSAGDLAIKFIAGVCQAEESANVRFARYGGDEFFAIVLGCQDKDLEALALRISEKIRSSGYEHVKNPNSKRLTVSIGVVNVDLKKSEHTVQDVVKYADKALYHAKDRGKDDVFVYHVMPNSEYSYSRISTDSFRFDQE
jgi:diguanylate cyclase (GGDEF)-like protein